MVPLLCLSVVNAVSRRSPCAPQQAAAAQRVSQGRGGARCCRLGTTGNDDMMIDIAKNLFVLFESHYIFYVEY